MYNISNLSRKAVYMKRILALFLCAVMILAAFASCAQSATDTEKTEETKGDELETLYLPKDIVLKSDNYSYTRAELSFAFYMNYLDFRYASSDNIDFYNIDVDASLKDQIYYDDLTWFDYFADMSLEYLEDILRYCEEAKVLGIELSESDLDEVEKAVQGYVNFAENYGYTVEEYLALQFNSDVTLDAVREYMKKEALGLKLYNEIIRSYEFSDEELNKHLNDNYSLFSYIDYVEYTFDEKTDLDAKAAAEALAEIKTVEGFDGYILDYMKNTLALEEKKQKTTDCYFSAEAYDEFSDFSKWAFKSGKDMQTYKKYDEVKGTYTVYLLTRAPYVHEKETKNLRLIAVDIDNYGSLYQVEERAKEILNEWKAGEATEDSFATLAKKVSDDNTTNLVGGLVEGVYESGEGVSEELSKWLYTEGRKAGDTEIFPADGYYYVVYFTGNGDKLWRIQVKNDLIQTAYGEYVEGLAKKYKIERMDEIIQSLDA